MQRQKYKAWETGVCPHQSCLDVNVPQWLGVTEDGKIGSNVTLDFFEGLLNTFLAHTTTQRIQQRFLLDNRCVKTLLLVISSEPFPVH